MFCWYITHNVLRVVPVAWWGSDTNRIICTMMLGLVLHVCLYGALEQGVLGTTFVAAAVRSYYPCFVAADMIAVAILFRQKWGHTLTDQVTDAITGPVSSPHGPKFASRYQVATTTEQGEHSKVDRAAPDSSCSNTDVGESGVGLDAENMQASNKHD